MDEYTIELDCAPGYPRPGDLLPGVLKETGLELGDPVSTLFGNWTWVVPQEQVELFLQHRSTIEKRIKALYKSGSIRYGSW